MSVALLSIGNELLRGDIANTNAQWLAEQLTGEGVDVAAMATAPDDPERLVIVLRQLLEQCPLVIATGGLGPTSDDVTAMAAAKMAGVELSSNADVLEAIRRRVQDRGRTLQAGHHKQAEIPDGAQVLHNSHGTAPGWVIRQAGKSMFFLPGVPLEMRHMFSDQVLPLVTEAATRSIYRICLHTVGVGETWLQEKLDEVIANHPAAKIGFRAKAQEVDVHVEGRSAESPAEARDAATKAARAVRQRLGKAVYGSDDQSMPQLVGRSLKRIGWRLAVAESCTGGLIARQLTSFPASDYFVGGTVAYANLAKTKLLGVAEDTIREHGAVSAEVAAEMAEGARRAFDCEVAVSVTGIAGPTGGTSDKPLGKCYWAVAHQSGTAIEQKVFSGERNQVQQKAAHAALDLLRRILAINATPSGRGGLG